VVGYVKQSQSVVCCQFVSKELAAAGCIFFLVLAFGSRSGKGVSICGCVCIDILILAYPLYNLIFFVPLPKN
jgi:hypothetical protein